MRLFLDAETVRIVPSFKGTFYRSSINHDDGFANHHYLAAWTVRIQLESSNLVTPLQYAYLVVEY
jgi:hypothetical protein